MAASLAPTAFGSAEDTTKRNFITVSSVPPKRVEPRKHSPWVVQTSWVLPNEPECSSEEIHVPRPAVKQGLWDFLLRRTPSNDLYDTYRGKTTWYPVTIHGDLQDAMALSSANLVAPTNYRIGNYVFYGLRPVACVESGKEYVCTYDYFVDTEMPAISEEHHLD